MRARAAGGSAGATGTGTRTAAGSGRAAAVAALALAATALSLAPVASAAPAAPATATAAAPAAPATSAAPAHGGAEPLVFVQAGEVRSLDLDDGHSATLASSAGGDVALAPDGKQVAYVAKDGSLHVVGIDGKGDRRVARGPLGSPLWRSSSEIGVTRPAAGNLFDAVVVTIGSGKERTVAKDVASEVFPLGADLVAKPAPGCATTDLYLGKQQLTKTPLQSELPLAADADLGIIAVVRTQASSFQCAPASVPVPTELRAFDVTGRSRSLVSLGKLPANRPADAAFRPAGTDFAYITAKGDLAVRSFLTQRDRIVARGPVTAVDW